MEPTKQRIREAARAERAGLAVAEVADAGRSRIERIGDFAPYVRAVSLLAYAAKGNEVPTGGVIDDALAKGKKVYLPRVATCEFVRYRSGAVLVDGAWGISEPTGSEVYRPGEPTLALVPLLAWDDAGHRVGRGRGWYDRALASLGADLTRVGVGYEFQWRERLPHEPSDVVLDFVITERRLVICHSPAPAGAASGRRGA